MTNYFDSILPKVQEWIDEQQGTPWIFLYGDLGSGKTTFVKELLGRQGFGDIQSPTFLKVLTYENPQGQVALHMDAYRIDQEQEFLRVGLENMEPDMGLVEWPEIFESFIANNPNFKEILNIENILRVRLPADHSLKNVRISPSGA